MKLETRIAIRYLFSKHKINFISFISYLSIGGITIGVSALLIVLSVFNGFSSLVKSFLLNIDPHIRIEAIDESAFEKLPEIENNFSSINEIKNFSRFVNGKVLAMQSKLNRVANIKGIDINEVENVYGLKTNIAIGNYNLENKNEFPKIIVGYLLADHLQSVVGDTIILISPSGIEKSIISFSLPQQQKFVISGIFISNNNEYDASYIFTDIASAQILLGYNNRFQGFELKLSDINKSEFVKNNLEKFLDKKYFSINTWYDFHKELYSVMQIERWTAYLILSLIIAVAVFNIFASLSMSVIEKKRDIGILIALGLENKSILKMFLTQGFLIGLIGTTLGFIIGVGVFYLHSTYNIYPLDPSQYKISALPMELKIFDFFVVGFSAIALSFIASIQPAKRAFNTDPIDAIKWE